MYKYAILHLSRSTAHHYTVTAGMQRERKTYHVYREAKSGQLLEPNLLCPESLYHLCRFPIYELRVYPTYIQTCTNVQINVAIVLFMCCCITYMEKSVMVFLLWRQTH